MKTTFLGQKHSFRLLKNSLILVFYSMNFAFLSSVIKNKRESGHVAFFATQNGACL